jgi:hypothetical protein
MERTTVCNNPWCKATFRFSDNDLINVDGVLEEPKKCKKCLSFSNDLSNGVTWQDKQYEGERYSNESHQIKYRVTNFKL